MLVFKADGTCGMEIGGEAIVPERYVGIPRSRDLEDVPLRYLRLIDGKVVRVPPTSEELAVREEARVREALFRNLLEDRLEVENRLRGLEGKEPLTKAQFVAALKTEAGP
jgi:hypothetical protein